jgi:DHA3 family tetracycline resistance protein-like MFS transporter
VGTIMELAVFLTEVPTGMVADLYSRQLSVILGLCIIGTGIALIGSYQRSGALRSGACSGALGARSLAGRISLGSPMQSGRSRPRQCICARRSSAKLVVAWANRGLAPYARATVLSMLSQAQALEVCGGPLLGLVGTLHTVRTPLVGAAMVLLPALPLYGQALRHSKQEAHEASL